jgi:hypothetical protein
MLHSWTAIRETSGGLWIDIEGLRLVGIVYVLMGVVGGCHVPRLMRVLMWDLLWLQVVLLVLLRMVLVLISMAHPVPQSSAFPSDRSIACSLGSYSGIPYPDESQVEGCSIHPQGTWGSRCL